MKGLPICFSEVQVKKDVTDNNNKHFVTAFEGECRNIIELREHLKLCFLIILYITACLGCVPISCYTRKITLKDSARAVCMASSVSTWPVICVFTSRHAPVLPPIQMADDLLAGTGSRDKYAIPFYLYPWGHSERAPSLL